MTEGEAGYLPAPRTSAEPVRPADRDRTVELLHQLVSSHDLDLDGFGKAMAVVLAVENTVELAEIVQSLPSTIRLTPAHRRLAEPLRIEVRGGVQKLAGTWQLGREVLVEVAGGVCKIDMTSAEFDDRSVDMTVRCHGGVTDLVVPHGVGIQLRAVGSGFTNRIEDPNVPPGFPLLRLDVATDGGLVRLARSKRRRSIKWMWRRVKRRD